MPPEDAGEPVADDEVLYRRVSDRSGWYDPSLDRPIAWEAFRPNERDLDGISLWRARSYESPERVARIGAKANRQYFLLVLRAGTLRSVGATMLPTPSPAGPGHVTLANLSAIEYRRDRNAVRELAESIAHDLVEDVEGPFGPFDVTEG